LTDVKEIPYHKHPLNHRCNNCNQMIDVLGYKYPLFTKDGTKRFYSTKCRNEWLNNYIGKDDL